MKASIKTARWKPSIQRFEFEWLLQIAQIQERLQNHSYRTGPQSRFIVRERGKTRLIRGNNVSDRIVRHILCDDVLTPTLQKFIAYDNAASQKGKGVDFARKRVSDHLHEYYRKHGSKGYVLLSDFSKYFDNIRHKEAFIEIAKKVKDPDARDLLIEVFRSMAVDVSYMTDEEYKSCMDEKFNSVAYAEIPEWKKTGTKFMRKSLCVGDQTSQVVGIFYPTRIDNYCKIVMGMRHYIRYMDDIMIVHESKEKLKEVLEGIRKISSEMGLYLNEKKTVIVPINRPFRFLQNSYYLTETGRVVERINSKKLTKMRRKLKKLAAKAERGDLPMEDVENVWKSWMGSHRRYMSKLQISHMDELREQLFSKGEENGKCNSDSERRGNDRNRLECNSDSERWNKDRNRLEWQQLHF